MADTDKPSTLEDEYFAREDIEKMRKLALEQSREMAEKQRAALRQLHHMKCPKCGMDLHTLRKGSVELDTCFHCHGMWLDSGELEKLLAEDHPQRGSVMKAVLNIFKK
ncbi:MAG TPA: zf-TFIIB domain-containing protein [Aggregicoccus sp.]|nr:zf-TFIIB domain-containing protein [Aggregicoccus sp.]